MSFENYHPYISRTHTRLPLSHVIKNTVVTAKLILRSTFFKKHLILNWYVFCLYVYVLRCESA